MIIAPHHIPGTAKHKLNKALGCDVEYTPVCPWPDDCMVQWGNGIIPANPFFEAFPPGTFIRGDGATIEEAERQAWAKYQREQICNHEWGRARRTQKGWQIYTNGGGWCKCCGAFRSEMFSPIFEIGSLRKPIGKGLVSMLEDDPEMDEHMDKVYPERIAERKKYKRQLRLRKNVFGVDETRYF